MLDLGLFHPNSQLSPLGHSPSEPGSGHVTPVRDIHFCAQSRPLRCTLAACTVVPPRLESLPFPVTAENNACMKDWLLQTFTSSTFYTCPHRPLPCEDGPPIKIHMDAGAQPKSCHTPHSIPIHWQEQVCADLLTDEALGVIEKVPYGEHVTWCHLMVLSRKPKGYPAGLLTCHLSTSIVRERLLSLNPLSTWLDVSRRAHGRLLPMPGMVSIAWYCVNRIKL